MFNILSLQELKRTGLAKIRQMFKSEPDILIQERGKDACVLVDLEYYNYLKNCELEIALIKAKKEIANGKFTTGVKSHVEQMENMLNEDPPGAIVNV